MIKTLTLKKGETFLLHGQYVEDDGITAKSLSGITLSSQVRDKQDKLVESLLITVTDEAQGLFTISSIGTELWTEGQLLWDLKQTENGVTSITDTAVINVIKAITR